MNMKNFLVLGVISLLLSCSGQETKESSKKKILRVSTIRDPMTLDPRLNRDLPSVSVMHLLFEGLMRSDSQGKLQPALAESYFISPDLKTYTFKIRECFWSNGNPITAEDFEQTWKSILDPKFPAPNAYQLYVIKGAKEAKEGKIPIDEVHVKAIDPQTLVVELNSPIPYFLEMTASHFYFPVSKNLRDPDYIEITEVISSGPFLLDSWKRHDELTAVKNPLYWDAANVALDGVAFVVLDDNTSLQLFKTHHLDWAGSPLSTIPQDAVTALKQQNQLKIAPGAGTHWYRFNTEKFPFYNKKMRQAFALALNRQDIVDHVTQGNQIPAIGIVPPSFGLERRAYYQDNSLLLAKKLFHEALEEMQFSQNNFPAVTLSYNASEREHKIAQTVQQQWSQAFGIDVELEKNENQVYYDKLAKGEFQISSGSWFADFKDPINFLEIFKIKENPTNHTRWEDQNYSHLLEESSLESDEIKRFELLAKAEAILMDAMPIAPLFYSSYNFVKNHTVHHVYFSELGFLDFSHAQLNVHD